MPRKAAKFFHFRFMTDYLNIFKVTQKDLQTLTDTALGYGGDYADLYFENTTYFNLMLKDGEVSSGGFHTDFGVGIRVLKGEKTGYAYSESTEMPDMLKAARAAGVIASGINGGRTYSTVSDRKLDVYPVKEDWRLQSPDRFLPFLKNLEREIFLRTPESSR